MWGLLASQARDTKYLLACEASNLRIKLKDLFEYLRKLIKILKKNLVLDNIFEILILVLKKLLI